MAKNTRPRAGGAWRTSMARRGGAPRLSFLVCLTCASEFLADRGSDLRRPLPRRPRRASPPQAACGVSLVLTSQGAVKKQGPEQGQAPLTANQKHASTAPVASVRHRRRGQPPHPWARVWWPCRSSAAAARAAPRSPRSRSRRSRATPNMNCSSARRIREHYRRPSTAISSIEEKGNRCSKTSGGGAS